MDYDLEITGAVSAEFTKSRLINVLILLLGVFIILLNSLVVISSGLLIEKRQQPRSCYILLGNLGLSNLLTGVAVVFGNFYPSRNDTSCAIQLGMIITLSLVSVFSVLLVAIDRFIYIMNGLKYQQWMFPNRVRILIVISWIIGLIVGFLPSFIPSLHGNMTEFQCFFILFKPGFVFATTLIGLIPILIVSILYSIILKKALKKIGQMKKATSVITANGFEINGDNSRSFRESSVDLTQMTIEGEQHVAVPLKKHSSSTNSRCFGWYSRSKLQSPENILMTTSSRKQPSRWKAIKVVMLTSGSFVITYVPYFIASTMFVYCDHENNSEYCDRIKYAIVNGLGILGFANSLLNPIIYAWWHNGFRTNVTRIYAKKFERIKWCRRCFSKSNDIATLSPRTTNLSSRLNLSSSTTNTTTTTAMADVNETVSPT